MADAVRQSGLPRLNIVLSRDVAAALDEMAVATDSTKTEVIRRAIGLMKLAHEEKRKGRHLGFTSSSEKLDTEIVGNF
ncbi:MAG: CopG family transcriptional regulator [Rhizobiales bacterium]|nr:CopG family transcriptional regulator [Hyphomicrobiales bacterium]